MLWLLELLFICLLLPPVLRLQYSLEIISKQHYTLLITNNGPDVFEQCVLEVPLLREANHGFLASVLHLLGRGP